MAASPKLDDIDHTWGEDLSLGPTGDLGRVNGPLRSEQRVVRRLMTNLREYIWQPEYGGSLPARIGSLINLPSIQTQIRGQMLLEPSVARNPPPLVKVRQIPKGVSVSVTYTSLPDKQPISLSFDLTG